LRSPPTPGIRILHSTNICPGTLLGNTAGCASRSESRFDHRSTSQHRSARRVTFAPSPLKQTHHDPPLLLVPEPVHSRPMTKARSVRLTRDALHLLRTPHHLGPDAPFRFQEPVERPGFGWCSSSTVLQTEDERCRKDESCCYFRMVSGRRTFYVPGRPLLSPSNADAGLVPPPPISGRWRCSGSGTGTSPGGLHPIEITVYFANGILTQALGISGRRSSGVPPRAMGSPIGLIPVCGQREPTANGCPQTAGIGVLARASIAALSARPGVHPPWPPLTGPLGDFSLDGSFPKSIGPCAGRGVHSATTTHGHTPRRRRLCG